MSRVALYVRVSTNKDQTVQNQLLVLRDWAAAHGHQIVAEFCDDGISGAKGKDKRPGLAALALAAGRREVDLIAITALDRLGRSLNHLVQFVAELEALRVGLFVRNLALDTSTPAGRLMFNVIGSLAEFERELIRERTLMGLERARRQGKKLGRPRVAPATERRISALLEAGTPANRVARMTCTGNAAVYRIKRELEACPLPT